jgi:hypothetical protein
MLCTHLHYTLPQVTASPLIDHNFIERAHAAREAQSSSAQTISLPHVFGDGSVVTVQRRADEVLLQTTGEAVWR